MDPYKHESGALKRKEREKRLEASKKGFRTLFEVGLKKEDSSNEDVSLESASRSTEICCKNDKVENQISSFQTEIEQPSLSRPKPIQLETSLLQSQNAEITLCKDKAETSTKEPLLQFETCESELFSNEDIPPESSPTLIRPNLVKDTLSDQYDLLQLPGCPTSDQLESYVRKGHNLIPECLPSDGKRPFPKVVLYSKSKIGETRPRDWLTWNKSNESFFRFPCRLFGRNSNDSSEKNRSILMSNQGWKKNILGESYTTSYQTMK